MNPYTGPDEIEPLTGQALVDEVAYFKQVADATGEPYDPEWDRWIREDQGLTHGAGGIAEAQRRFG